MTDSEQMCPKSLVHILYWPIIFLRSSWHRCVLQSFQQTSTNWWRTTSQQTLKTVQHNLSFLKTKTLNRRKLATQENIQLLSNGMFWPPFMADYSLRPYLRKLFFRVHCKARSDNVPGITSPVALATNWLARLNPLRQITADAALQGLSLRPSLVCTNVRRSSQQHLLSPYISSLWNVGAVSWAIAWRRHSTTTIPYRFLQAWSDRNSNIIQVKKSTRMSFLTSCPWKHVSWPSSGSGLCTTCFSHPSCGLG